MSPEQIYGSKNITNTTDIYSLGVLAYHCLTGHVPFDGNSQYVIFNKHIKSPVPPLAKFSPALDHPQLQALIEKMMAKRPNDRPQNAREILEAFRLLKESREEWFGVSHPLLTAEVPINRGNTRSVHLDDLKTPITYPKGAGANLQTSNTHAQIQKLLKSW